MIPKPFSHPISLRARIVGVVLGITVSPAVASQLYAQECPTATAARTGWSRHADARYAVEISAPSSYRTVNFNRRGSNYDSLAGSIPQPFAVWKTAATRLEFHSPTSYEAEAVLRFTGPIWTLKTEAGNLQLMIWRSIGKQYTGRDTTYFNASGEIRQPGLPHVVVHLIAHDSVGLLENLQILQTLRRPKPDDTPTSSHSTWLSLWLRCVRTGICNAGMAAGTRSALYDSEDAFSYHVALYAQSGNRKRAVATRGIDCSRASSPYNLRVL